MRGPKELEFLGAVYGIPGSLEYVGRVPKTSPSAESPLDTTKLERMLCNPRSLPVITTLFSTFRNPITTEELACALRRKKSYIDLTRIPTLLAELKEARICELRAEPGSRRFKEVESNIPQRWGLTGQALQYLAPKLCNFLP